MTKADIAREYLGKFDVPKNSLAKKLCKDFPLIFHDVEQARAVIRYVTGAQGKKHRRMKDEKKRGFFVKGKSQGFEPIEGDLTDFEPFQIPLSVGELNIWGDVHAPFHDHNAISKAFSKRKGKALLLNGDGADMYHLSKFVKDPRKISKRTLQQDRDIVKTLFSQIREQFDHVYYKKGNHCVRWESFLKIKAPELYDFSEFKFEFVYGLTELGIHVIEGHQEIQYGDLSIVHGHEFGGYGGGKFVAKSLIKKWQTYKKQMQVKVLCSHHHYTDDYVLHNDDGSYAYGWTTGCLSGLNVEYSPFNRYNHGFAIAEEGKKGVEVDNIVL